MIYWKVSLVDTSGGTCYVLTDETHAREAIHEFESNLAATSLTIEGVTNNAKRDPVILCVKTENLVTVLAEKL